MTGVQTCALPIFEGADKEYEEGYIGIQLYAQQGHFDNIVIENTWAVDPRKKVSTTWAQIKNDRD